MFRIASLALFALAACGEPRCLDIELTVFGASEGQVRILVEQPVDVTSRWDDERQATVLHVRRYESFVYLEDGYFAEPVGWRDQVRRLLYEAERSSGGAPVARLGVDRARRNRAGAMRGRARRSLPVPAARRTVRRNARALRP
jgi:hypothetical protein